MIFRNLALAGAALLSFHAGPINAQGMASQMGVSVDLREDVRNTYIFVFRAAMTPETVRQQALELAARAGGQVTHVYTHSIQGFAARLPDQAAARLIENNPLIDYAEPDQIAFAFPKPQKGGGGGDTPCTSPQQTPWGILAVGGPIVDGRIGSAAWVIDSGIDFEHPDLNVDTNRSRSFLTRRASADDGNGHGTHVAGTIGALDNTCDVVGVAPGVPLVAVRVLDNSGSGSYSGVIAGVDYVAKTAKAGDVANMSLGGPYSKSLNDAVILAAAKGIYFSLAAGNESDDASAYSPASAEGANIYTVSAVDSNNAFAWFSNYGSPVDCAGPGVGVLSTKNGGGTTSFSGTSMAAPHVAGLLLFGPPALGNSVSGDPDGSPDRLCIR